MLLLRVLLHRPSWAPDSSSGRPGCDSEPLLPFNVLSFRKISKPVTSNNQGYQGGSCWGNDGNGLSTAIMITLTHISNTVELKYPVCFWMYLMWCENKWTGKKQKEMYNTKLNSSSVGNLGCKWLCANCHHVKKWLHETLVVLSRSNLFGPPEF